MLGRFASIIVLFLLGCCLIMSGSQVFQGYFLAFGGFAGRSQFLCCLTFLYSLHGQDEKLMNVEEPILGLSLTRTVRMRREITRFNVYAWAEKATIPCYS